MSVIVKGVQRIGNGMFYHLSGTKDNEKTRPAAKVFHSWDHNAAIIIRGMRLTHGYDITMGVFRIFFPYAHSPFRRLRGSLFGNKVDSWDWLNADTSCWQASGGVGYILIGFWKAAWSFCPPIQYWEPVDPNVDFLFEDMTLLFHQPGWMRPVKTYSWNTEWYSTSTPYFINTGNGPKYLWNGNNATMVDEIPMDKNLPANFDKQKYVDLFTTNNYGKRFFIKEASSWSSFYNHYVMTTKYYESSTAHYDLVTGVSAWDEPSIAYTKQTNYRRYTYWRNALFSSVGNLWWNSNSSVPFINPQIIRSKFRNIGWRHKKTYAIMSLKNVPIYVPRLYRFTIPKYINKDFV